MPDDIATADAALLGCAVTTGVGAVIKTAKVTPGSSVLVIGLGGVGLSVLQGARLAGASTIIAVDRNSEKEPAARAAGAHHFVPADQDTKSAVRDLTAMRGADFAFDCAGSSRTIRDMWSMTRRAERHRRRHRRQGRQGVVQCVGALLLRTYPPRLRRRVA